MPTIKQVETAVLSRENDIKQETKEKYIRKFKIIIKGCDNSNFVERFNDTEYIKNVYLKDKSPRTIITYIGDIMAINGSIVLLTPENLKKLIDYREIQKTIVEEAKKAKPVVAEAVENVERTIAEDSDSIVVEDTESEVESESDYGFYHDEPEVKDTLEHKKIALRYELERLQERIRKIHTTLEILDEV